MVFPVLQAQDMWISKPGINERSCRSLLLLPAGESRSGHGDNTSLQMNAKTSLTLGSCNKSLESQRGLIVEIDKFFQ